MKYFLLGAPIVFVAASLFFVIPNMSFGQQGTNLQICVVATSTDPCPTPPITPVATTSTSTTSGGNTGGGGGNGGSGGGGGIISNFNPKVVTKVTFKGKAYLGGKITLLKDAQIASTTKTNSLGEFEISLSDVNKGTFNFGLWAEDINGNRSKTFSFVMNVVPEMLNSASGILMSPTVSADKTEVKQGDFLIISGQSYASSTLNIFLNYIKLAQTVMTNKNGMWSYKLDTSKKDYGSYSILVQASTTEGLSDFSSDLLFKIGDKNVLTVKGKKAFRDPSRDGRVDLLDFSLESYWYGKPNPPENVDLNGDGKVTLADFSILAYYWTG